ncbi:hypothetical protein DMB37_02925 [Nocardia sp. CS682]|nr:hypothetical protein DMB37_02925 [Nocardia sp. CS682]
MAGRARATATPTRAGDVHFTPSRLQHVGYLVGDHDTAATEAEQYRVYAAAAARVGGLPRDDREKT